MWSDWIDWDKCYNFRDNQEYKAAEKLEQHLLEQARRDKHYKKNYGLSLEDYEDRVDEQQGKCAICGEFPQSGKLLCVDHDHETGKVRSLLCHACNVGMRQFEKTVGPFLQYLTKWGKLK
jgi:hypothetical protein